MEEARENINEIEQYKLVIERRKMPPIYIKKVLILL